MLAEAHSALLTNALCDRVTICVDGEICTGRDIAIAAMMGAEEFGFGTITMIAEGCVMASICHLNTCPVGVSSQKEQLCKKFQGSPEYIVNFFLFVAEEIRNIMAHPSYSKFEDLIGRADLLKSDKAKLDRIAKTDGVSLESYFWGIPDSAGDCSVLMSNEDHEHTKEEIIHCNGFSSDLDHDVSCHPNEKKVIEVNDDATTVNFSIKNTNCSTCAMLAGDIARAHGNTGFKRSINVNFSVSAGQLFGAFVLP